MYIWKTWKRRCWIIIEVLVWFYIILTLLVMLDYCYKMSFIDWVYKKNCDHDSKEFYSVQDKLFFFFNKYMVNFRVCSSSTTYASWWYSYKWNIRCQRRRKLESCLEINLYIFSYLFIFKYILIYNAIQF